MKNPFTIVKTFFAAGYDAATNSPHQPNLPYSRRVDKDEESLLGKWDRNTLLLKCRNLRRNDAITAGIVERFSDNVVGSGIKPQAKTSDTKWNDEAEAFWNNWAKVCDVRQRVDMRSFEKLVTEERLLSGDCGFVMTKGGQLQPVEAGRIATPDELRGKGNIVDGVKVHAKTGISLGYYVFGRDANGAVDTASKNWDFVPSSNFIFVMKPNRFDQVRGIPELAPIVNSVQYVHDLQMSTLEKAKMDSYKAWFIGSDNNNGPGNLGARNASKGVDGDTYEKQLSGQTIYGNSGDEVKSLASNTPNPQYVAFMEKSLRIIGSALGLPYEFVLLDFSKGSFSSSRAALLQTYRTFTDWQEWLTRTFLQRVWNWRIAKAIKAGELRQAPIGANGVSEWFKVEWSFPEFGWVDPQNEAQANLLEWQLGTNTITQMNRKKGKDVEDVFAEKAKELSYAQRVADEANALTPGLNLTRHDIISAQIPGQTQPAVEVASTEEDGNETD